MVHFYVLFRAVYETIFLWNNNNKNALHLFAFHGYILCLELFLLIRSNLRPLLKSKDTCYIHYIQVQRNKFTVSSSLHPAFRCPSPHNKFYRFASAPYGYGYKWSHRAFSGNALAWPAKMNSTETQTKNEQLSSTQHRLLLGNMTSNKKLFKKIVHQKVPITCSFIFKKNTIWESIKWSISKNQLVRKSYEWQNMVICYRNKVMTGSNTLIPLISIP